MGSDSSIKTKTLGFNWKWFNPVAWHLQHLMRDTSKRLIVLYGGSSSGKSYSVAQTILMMTLFTADNSIVMRKVGASISKTIYEDFKVAARQMEIASYFKFKESVRRIECKLNGAHIDFAGLDDPEKIKGISNYRWVFMDEWSEFDEVDFKQIRKRLRGKLGQQIIAAFNPIKETHWIKASVFDTQEWIEQPNDEVGGERRRIYRVKSVKLNKPKPIIDIRTGEVAEHPSDTVIIQSTYLNNFWVVGSPDGTYGYYDEQCIADFERDRLHDPDYYNVYALGEWGVIRTGAEFFPSFNRGRHCADTAYDPALRIHVSVDNNRLPYISYTFWQVSHECDGTSLRQIHEICAASPHNSALKSARLVAAWLRSIGYADRLYLHGDASTRAGNTTDDEGRSFLDKVISTLTDEGFDVVDCVGVCNPSVPMTGEFINATFDGMIQGYSITIGNSCKKSAEDYQAVQKDANGAIKKRRVKDKVTLQTYEENGHLSDTFRYVVHDLMNDAYVRFSNRRKRNLFARDGLIHYFNDDADNAYSGELVYCMPNLGGRCMVVYGRRCGDKWHILDVADFETSSTQDVAQKLGDIGCSPTYVECSKAYYPFIRELRAGGLYPVKVVPEEPDLDKRIAATSDYVRNHILFSRAKSEGDNGYAAFIDSLLDYNQEQRQRGTSAVLSGFCKAAAKLVQ